jgi:hypothetical protein
VKIKIQKDRLHALADHCWASLLVLLSLLAPTGDTVGNLMLVCGLSIIIYNVFTAYGGGFVKVLPIKAHLMLDYLTSVTLIIVPWFIAYDNCFLTVLMGVIGLVLATGKTVEEAQGVKSVDAAPGPPLT